MATHSEHMIVQAIDRQSEGETGNPREDNENDQHRFRAPDAGRFFTHRGVGTHATHGGKIKHYEPMVTNASYPTLRSACN